MANRGVVEACGTTSAADVEKISRNLRRRNAVLRARLVGLLPLCVLLASCGGGGGSTTPPPVVPPPVTYTATSGVAQKGPLIRGSTVTAQELDARLSPTGTQYTYQVTSDLGAFSPTSTFGRQYVGLNATGYYFDEVENVVSSGTVALTGYSDVSADSVLNVNLLTTLAYQRIQHLVAGSNMTFAEARTQAENEVLRALGIPGGNYGSFGTLDLGGGTDGDHMLAAISSVFVYGNSAGSLSQLIADFQSDIGTDGVITDAATVATLAASAKAIDPAAVAANLTQQYASAGVTFTAANISDWLDPAGDGLVGRFKFEVQNAAQSSTFVFPSHVASWFAGLPLSATGGQLSVNGTIATGAVTLQATDTIALSPGTSAFQQGILIVYLVVDGRNVAVVNFVSGVHSLATLQSITVTPDPPRFGVGSAQQLVATGTYADGTTGDVTSEVTWSSTNTAVATIGSTTGFATGVSTGSATISATGGAITALLPVTIAAAGWHVAAAPTNERSTPAATLLPSGNVLVAGGDWVSASATAEVYDPSSDTWSPPVTFASHGLSQHSLTVLSTGKVLVAGGVDSSTPVGVSVAAVEIYDPVANTWSVGAPLPAARSAHTATALPNGKVLVVGGMTTTWDGFQVYRVHLASAELYDPTTDTWSPTGSLSAPRSGHTATLLANGKVLVAAGSDSSLDPLASAELYNPQDGTWSSAGSLTTARRSHTATLLPNGDVLVTGGFGASALASAEIYNPQSGTWSPGASLSTARISHSATSLLSGRVLVAGGGGDSGAESSVEIYNPVSGTWSPTADLLKGGANMAAVLLATGQVFVVDAIGGRPTAELYW